MVRINDTALDQLRVAILQAESHICYLSVCRSIPAEVKKNHITTLQALLEYALIQIEKEWPCDMVTFARQVEAKLKLLKETGL